jgi:hypothetical protein
MKRLVILAGVLLFITACEDGGSSLSLHSKNWDCEDLKCEASFVIENLHESDTDLMYSIRLYKSIDDSGNQVPETLVGEASGRIEIQSQVKQTVTAQISVSEEPNGMAAGVATAN